MATITVTSTADSGAGSLRQALADAASGDTIVFDSTTFPANTETTIYLSSQISLPAITLTIDGGETWTDDGELKTRVVLDGQNAYRCIYGSLNGAVNANGVTFLNCIRTNSGDNGGAVQIRNNNGETNNFNYCRFDTCEAPSGGAFYSFNSNTVNIEYCIFTNCTAVSGGAIGAYSGTFVNALNCVFKNNSATNGGAFYTSGTSSATLNNCTFYACEGTSGGGVCGLGSSIVTLTSCEFNACVSSASGGGAIFQNASSATFNNCVFNACEGTGGGGFCSSTTVGAVLNACVFDSCVGTLGGGVYTSGSGICTLNNCVFRNNVTTSNAIDATSTASSSITINGGTFETSTSSVNIKNGANYNGILTIEGVVNVNNIELASNSNVVINGNLTAAVLNAPNTLYVTFDGTDRILAVTNAAAIGAATLSAAADSTGYAAFPAGTNISSATFTGVTAAYYGADIQSVSYVRPNVVYTATDATVPVLLQTRFNESDAWTSVGFLSESPYSYPQTAAFELRLFDGSFHTASYPGLNVYYELTANTTIGYLQTKNSIGYLRSKNSIGYLN